ncbi:MAG: hypothetical protein PHU23_12350, partial [Dehalococcoidales bacterium]|nr:hypothetical protein [Dehalococcoidales bacterium]
MPEDKHKVVGSGVRALDDLLQGIRLGDNVVCQVDDLNDYSFFAESIALQSISDGLKVIYVKFAEHAQILEARPGLTIVNVDPSPGFDFFSSAIHRIIEENGENVCYIFDNLSDLVNSWATDELLANFFQFTCPYLYELNTVTYFALTRNQHAPGTVARIRETTQILIDLYHVKNQVYIHPLKVWDRYSSRMFLPHLFSDDKLIALFSSGEASAISAAASQRQVRISSSSIAPWDSIYNKLLQHHENNINDAEKAVEITALQQELTRMLFGSHQQFNNLLERYLTVDDLIKVRDRMIGSGRIGGKA